ncbi:tRNA1(Val) (adenine(37)-N6)-methyltransferase [Hydrogenothermus marinus]|uniref:tRNA1(Val) A37 N6-methylase TrmN6 n=1 Tax=Hydrogenothermus marinus TaxID=133270 RepID=A0A3M0BKV5_9AQUI|nr:methyltransferase [Hydrogenothermus marinus]RMA97787.1 tRNA1(Val) A37 N6-methylase TrmN6 [Hydrogenothermus marinus]
MDKNKPSPFIRGKIFLYQSEKGYRFNLDSVLLASFPKFQKKGKLIDLGTGNGILILLLSLKYKNLDFYAIEVQEEFYNLAKVNFKLNNVNVNLFKEDIKNIKKIFKPNSFDYVITNPPYFKEYKTENLQLKIARSEYLATIEDFIKAGKYLLKDKGKFYMVSPVSRFSEIILYLKENKLQPKRYRFIYPSVNENATHFLLEAHKNAKEGGEIIEKPLIVYENPKDKIYTEEVKFILEEFI